MGNYCRYGVLVAVYLIVVAMSSGSEGRELRPTDHGLEYQSNATAAETGEESSEMQTFFGGRRNASAASRLPIPEANDPSDQEWWRKVTSGDSGGGWRKDRVREALMVATLVCGTAGVGLLVVAALLFIFQSHRQKSTTSITK